MFAIQKPYPTFRIMKLLKKFSVVFTLFMISCSPSTNKKTDINFGDYLKTLDTVPLPFEHSCSGPNFPQLSAHFDSAGFVKYKDADCARPLGILFNNKVNTIIVDLSNGDACVVPILVSYDKDGHKLDSLNLYGHSYDDTASSSMPYSKIDRNKHIVVIDTITTWKNYASAKMTSDSRKIKIDSTIYSLSEKGKFIKVSGKKL